MAWLDPMPKNPKPMLNVASPLESVVTDVPEDVVVSPSPKPLVSLPMPKKEVCGLRRIACSVIAIIWLRRWSS